jgi:hypothetical protein
VKLGEIAYARSGDKGENSNIGIAAINPKDYPFLCQFLTEDRVGQFFRKWNPRGVKRYELPKIYALNFILYQVLDGGASLNLRVDAQGKALGQALLQLDVTDAYAAYPH